MVDSSLWEFKRKLRHLNQIRTVAFLQLNLNEVSDELRYRKYCLKEGRGATAANWGSAEQRVRAIKSLREWNWLIFNFSRAHEEITQELRIIQGSQILKSDSRIWRIWSRITSRISTYRNLESYGQNL